MVKNDHKSLMLCSTDKNLINLKQTLDFYGAFTQPSARVNNELLPAAPTYTNLTLNWTYTWLEYSNQYRIRYSSSILNKWQVVFLLPFPVHYYSTVVKWLCCFSDSDKTTEKSVIESVDWKNSLTECYYI